MSRIPIKDLAVFATDAIASGVSITTLSHQLAAYMIEHRQSRDVPKLLRAIEAEMNTRGSIQVTITSAYPLDQNMKMTMAALLGVKNPIFTEQLDSSVIGGAEASAGEQRIDLTVRGKLKAFKQQIVNASKE